MSCDESDQTKGRLNEDNLLRVVSKVMAKRTRSVPAATPEPAAVKTQATNMLVTPLVPVSSTTEPKSESPPEMVSEREELRPIRSTRKKVQTSSSRSILQSLRVSEDEYKPYQLFTVVVNAIIASLEMEQKKLQISEDFETNGKLERGGVFLLLWHTPEHNSAKKKTAEEPQEMKSFVDNDSQKGDIDGEDTSKLTKKNTASSAKSKRKLQPNRKKAMRGHEWRALEESIQLKGRLKFNKNQNEFLIVGFLGIGETSRVWRAISEVEGADGRISWRACVIKYWIKVYDHEKKEYLGTKRIEAESKKAASTEVENYRKIYPALHDYVGHIRLNARWTVVLPFFKPAKRNQCTLDKVKTVLENDFYVEGVSYQFKKEDWRWRHVGEWDGMTVLFDLADLQIEEKVGQVGHLAYVKAHIEKLQRRMNGPMQDSGR